MSLSEITTNLGESYKAWKDGEKDKDKYRKEFFEAIDKELGKQKPAEKYVTVGHRGMAEEDAREILAKKFPTWIVDEIRPSDEGWEAILLEIISFTPYTYINAEDGQAYQRQVSAGSVYVDDERLQQEDPDLWLKVTELPNAEWIQNLMYHCGVDGNDIDTDLEEYLRILPGAPQRKLKDLESLDAESLAALSEYIYEGRPTVKLAAPRKAKAEELE